MARNTKVPCKITDCANPWYSLELCSKHYARYRRHGDPNTVLKTHAFPYDDHTKTCSSCLVLLPNRAFSKVPISKHKSGFNSVCKECVNLNHRLKVYNLTATQYNEMLSSQSNACAICEDRLQPLVVDHDHTCCPGHKSCGKCVRGLICQRCNKMLGFAQDNIEVLQRGVDYLAR